ETDRLLAVWSLAEQDGSAYRCSLRLGAAAGETSVAPAPRRAVDAWRALLAGAGDGLREAGALADALILRLEAVPLGRSEREGAFVEWPALRRGLERDGDRVFPRLRSLGYDALALQRVVPARDP